MKTPSLTFPYDVLHPVELAVNLDILLEDSIYDANEAATERITRSHTLLADQLQAVLDVLTEAEQGDYATSSRDFGRGVSFLAKQIRERLST